MAVKPNQTNEGGVSSKLYTGVANLKVVAINPNQAKLKELGYRAEKEPSYFDEKNGHRIAFYLEGKDGENLIRTNDAYFIKNVTRPEIFINREGKFGKDRSKLTGEVRNPFQGEVDLLNFIADWCNINKGEECVLDSIAKIAATGDLFELNDILSNAGENTFKGLLGVKDGKYQRLYQKKRLRSWSDNLTYLHKSLVDNEQYIKEDYGPIDFKLFVPSQFNLKPWNGTAAATAETTATGTASSNGQQTSAPTDESPAPGVGDEPPF